ncbi:MAG: dockerin type I domain-containing protein [Planctomycetota bacterium]
MGFIACTEADEIMIEVSAIATGSIGASDFTNAAMTITGVGDTQNVVLQGNSNLLLDDLVVTVEIEGVASAVFTDAIQAVSNNTSDLGGFGNTSNEFGLLFIFNDAFAKYDLTTDLDPVSGFGVIVIGVPHQTTMGSLRLFGISGDATFRSTVADSSCVFAPGDVNQDGKINLLDVDPFVNALANGTFLCEADMNEDGSVDLLDVDPFVSALAGE